MPQLSYKILATALYGACLQPGLAQLPPATTLQVDYDNFVVYTYDVNDSSKFATDQNTTTSSAGLQQGGLRTFIPFIGFADIVAVNAAGRLGAWIQYRSVRGRGYRNLAVAWRNGTLFRFPRAAGEFGQFLP